MEKIEEGKDIGEVKGIPEVIKGIRDKQDGEPESDKKIVNPFGFLNISKQASARIQEDADNSQIAKLLNHLIFGLTPCYNRTLTEEDVNKINPGGGVVASIMVVAPNLSLNHPFLILTIRLVTLYLKVKVMCGKVKDGVERVKSEMVGGVKEGFEKTIEHK